MRIPEMYNQSSMYSGCPMFNQTPMIPMMDYDMPFDEPRQAPTPPGTTGGPDFTLEPGPPVQQNIEYTQGWLATQIGKYMKFEFLIGTNLFIDREGILKEVGISYIVIEESGTNDLVMCDIYSIKFAKVFRDQSKVESLR